MICYCLISIEQSGIAFFSELGIDLMVI